MKHAQIRFSKATTDTARAVSGDTYGRPVGDEPAYVAEMVTEHTRAPIAFIRREKMAGSGSCNMWGSRYRWAVMVRRTRIYGTKREPTPNVHGVCTFYFDTYTEARECVNETVMDIVAAAFGAAVSDNEEN